jgi:lipoprotein-anchoring transpeptidase ErfK/SrfK
MHFAALFLAVIFSVWGFCGCSSTAVIRGGEASAYRAFKEREDYPETEAVYRNARLLALAQEAGADQAREIRIDLSDQRARLMVGEAVAMDAPCCTGRAGKGTPTGVFSITEKLADKRSTIFGRLYRNGKQVFRGDRRRYGGRYDRYVGASLPHWMRLTDDGIGLHGSHYVHRYPKSNGCVRLPQDVVAAMFAAVETGTPVHVRP